MRTAVTPMSTLKRGELPHDIPKIIDKLKDKLKDDAPDFRNIRCPYCQWQPSPLSLWRCVDQGHPEYFAGGCGTTWNTFITRGCCPGCSHHWHYTACLQCANWSPHDEWYVE